MRTGGSEARPCCSPELPSGAAPARGRARPLAASGFKDLTVWFVTRGLVTAASVVFFSPSHAAEGQSRSGENQQSGDTEAPGTKLPPNQHGIGKITDGHS